MFFFKRKKDNEVKIPSAEEMVERTNKYVTYTIEEIVREMVKNADRGKHHVILRGYISKDGAKKLRKKGLKVEAYELANSPYVKISWPEKKKH